MGATAQALKMIDRHNLMKKGVVMMELGCQNIYATENDFKDAKYGMIAKDFFTKRGVKHTSIDLCGCQKSIKFDLRDDFPKKWINKFDVVTNFGTTEHVETKEGFWKAFKNIHDSCKVGGKMIHRIPKTGNWKDHGEHYVTTDFFSELAQLNGYKIHDLGYHPAMGNVKDGWIVYAVLEKQLDQDFMDTDDFLKLDIRNS